MAAIQNTRIVIANTEIATSINPAHVRKLMQFSKLTGHSLSETLDRAIDNFMSIEAPVYLAQAKRKRDQKV
jgi:hypothetical protein